MNQERDYPTTMANEHQLAEPGQETLPFEMGYLPPYYKRKAEIELHESPENKEKGLKLLREMAENDKNFKDQVFDDDFLLQFLRTRKYDVASAFSRLKKFVVFRKKYSEMFIDIRFDRISIITRNDIVTFLPRRCSDGCAILHVTLGNWDPEVFCPQDLKRAVVVLLMQSLRDPMNQVNGYKLIFDVNCNPTKILRYCTPSNLYVMCYGPLECSTARFKGIHIVNLPFLLHATWILVKTFFSNKIKQRVVLHSSNETLREYFPKSVLPQEYGGDLDKHDMTGWLQKVSQPDKLATLVGGLSQRARDNRRSRISKNLDHNE